MDFSAYEFSSLQEGQFTLHRGLSARLEPILLLACSDEYTSPRSLQRLEHEHALRADLDAECAARPMLSPAEEPAEPRRGGEGLEAANLDTMQASQIHVGHREDIL